MCCTNARSTPRAHTCSWSAETATADASPLSYQAVVRGFARRLDRLGIRTPETTPHALRHTHATAMWEGGMRELALQKRLGHASPESVRIYTRVSDEQVLADYAAALRDRS